MSTPLAGVIAHHMFRAPGPGSMTLKVVDSTGREIEPDAHGAYEVAAGPVMVTMTTTQPSRAVMDAIEPLRDPSVPGPPDGWVEIEEAMSNFDGSIDDGFEDKLREGGAWGRHAAWDFNGHVWFADGRFHEQVWRYRAPVETFSADTLRDLMETVNEEYGWR